MLKKILILSFIFSCKLSSQQLSWPEITKETKPWTRWWWPGSIVNAADITSAMEKYQKAGLGGLEITPIYGVKGQEEKFITYLSPKWMEMLVHTLKEAERLGLGIDMANASGWPFGGPWVEPTDACKNINYKIFNLETGDTLPEKIEFIQQPLVRHVGLRPDISKLKYPVSKNDSLQIYALDQLRYEMSLPLHLLMAYSASGDAVNLTGLVNREKKLEWTPPEGEWTLYALFEGWHGKMVERAGPGGEGDVIDHFSGKAITDYLNHFDKAFENHNLSYLRGFFNDSYEVDDASGQADWTDDLFYEFYVRRGYDLRYHLPALFQKDEPDKNKRVLSDYRQTISDMLLEKFTVTWTSWAHRQGKSTRNQAHGSPGNILDLYAACDIPETEGNEITRFKFASSAANVTGKPYASCEAATWLNEHFLSSLSDVKKILDLFFLAGINHVVYHGTCFSPENEPWPGFLFYAATEFTPSNPLWNDFSQLNKYVARIQSFLQKGWSDNDILIYYPVFDRYAEYGRGLLEHFDALTPAFEGTHFKAAAELMLEKGYAFDYISDLQISNTQVYNELLETEGNSYKTIVIPHCKYIPLETFWQILNLAKEGAYIIFYGEMPENVSGFANIDEKNEIFTRLKESVTFLTFNNIMRATFGEGTILAGNDLESLLSFAHVRREAMTDYGIKFTRRGNDAGTIYFVSNQSDKPFDGWLPLSVKVSSAAFFNPETSRYGTAKIRAANSMETEVYLRLSPGETMIIDTYNKSISAQTYLFFDKLSSGSEIKGRWKIDFISGGPVLPPPVETDRLVSWTLSGGEDAVNFSGTATYRISFARPSGKADGWLLDLGRVCESARVSLNGEELAVLTGPDFNIFIDRKKLKPENLLEIKVSNLMANRIAYMDRNNIEWKKFYNVNMAARMKQNSKNGVFDASSWEPKESGLLGPVTLTPLKTMKQ